MRSEKLYYYLAILVSIFYRIFREDRNKLSYRTLVAVIGKSVGNINGEFLPFVSERVVKGEAAS